MSLQSILAGRWMQNVKLVKSVFSMLIANIYISISLSSLRVMVPWFRSWKYYVHGLLFIKFDHIAVCLLCNLVKISLVLQASLPKSLATYCLKVYSSQHYKLQHCQVIYKFKCLLSFDTVSTTIALFAVSPGVYYHWSILPFVCQSSSSLALVGGQA